MCVCVCVRVCAYHLKLNICSLSSGVGVDNMFILISAWRRSINVQQAGDTRDRVCIRMARTMREAALSITITSVTDVLAFSIGAITDFPTVELFCLYTGRCGRVIHMIDNYSMALFFKKSIKIPETGGGGLSLTGTRLK